MNPQKLEEIATKNSQESKVISTTEALRKMIASGAVEYSEKYQKHVAEIYWFPYVLDNDMHTIIAGKQSQFYSKTEKRFICTGTGHQLSHQALIDDFFLIFFIYLVFENVVSHGALNPVGQEGHFTLLIGKLSVDALTQIVESQT